MADISCAPLGPRPRLSYPPLSPTAGADPVKVQQQPLVPSAQTDILWGAKSDFRQNVITDSCINFLFPQNFWSSVFGGDYFFLKRNTFWTLPH